MYHYVPVVELSQIDPFFMALWTRKGVSVPPSEPIGNSFCERKYYEKGKKIVEPLNPSLFSKQNSSSIWGIVEQGTHQQ
jgi:hypothetical protein